MRKYYLDHARCGIVLLVILYHVVYLLNSVGVITNVDIAGIPEMDVLLCLCYPWFMCALFLISGITARLTLERDREEGKGVGAFLRRKCRTILLPALSCQFLIGWTIGWVTNQYNDMFGGQKVPGIVRYLIYALTGTGPAWFCHQLMVCFLVLALIRKLDRRDALWRLGGKAKLWTLFLLFLPVWGAAQVGNLPVVEIYRNGIYILFFLLGYAVFSHRETEDLLERYAPLFLVLGGILAVAYTAVNRGQNYAEMARLKEPLTNAFAWFGTLAALSAAKRFGDRETGFTRYLRERSFSFYLFHYPVLCLTAFLLDRYLSPAPAAMYVLLTAAAALILPPLSAVVRRTPVLRTLFLGAKWKTARTVSPPRSG